MGELVKHGTVSRAVALLHRNDGTLDEIDLARGAGRCLHVAVY